MTAKCASCSYPLTISDSIVCYECTSCFHVDCAQLVGFPFFELSSDPNRNRFLCATCQILPLPQHRSDSDSDSDTDIEGVRDLTMPSRQLDYHLDAQGDFAKDMNEIKGSVQDLSELCKDMLREINDLKSINLTLRCCVENLRHENEERDGVITNLRLRLDALELSGRIDKNKNDLDALGSVFDKDVSLERYLTPEREEPEGVDVSRKKRETNNSEHFGAGSDFTSFHTEEETERFEDENEASCSKRSLEEYTQKESKKEEMDSELRYSEYEQRSENEEDGENEENEKTITSNSSAEKKEDVACETEENRQDWSWRGNNAVELEEAEHGNDNAEDEEENEESETENEDAQSWQILDEEIQHNTLSNRMSEGSTTYDTWNENKDEEENFEEEFEEEERKEQLFSSVTKRLGTNSEEDDWRISNKNEDKGIYYDEDDIEGLEGEEDDYQTTDMKVEEKESTNEGDEDKTLEKEEGETEAPTGEEGEKPPEGLETAEAVEGVLEGEPRPEGELCLEGEPRLEGEPTLEGESHPEGQQDGEAGPEGQSRLEGAPLAEGGEGAEEGQLGGGQSPEDGEVQPPGTPEPPIPQHSEEDLWEYLKESVTSEHPATVEEFVQKLVGTLQHVPQEYLLPVIDANIKRATSPSVTDGEHLPPEEGVILPEGEVVHGGESTEPVTTGGDTVQAAEGETPSGETEVSTEGETLAPEAREGTEADGYPVVEAAA